LAKTLKFLAHSVGSITRHTCS